MTVHNCNYDELEPKIVAQRVRYYKKQATDLREARKVDAEKIATFARVIEREDLVVKSLKAKLKAKVETQDCIVEVLQDGEWQYETNGTRDYCLGYVEAGKKFGHASRRLWIRFWRPLRR